ncbi:MAG TPA: hypothetical protein VJ738_00135 [Steroidobacteraceae bacterium]|nr:hypothetical protein [Steroidobacteraceae bacterium]
MDNNWDIPAVLYSTRNIYIGIAVLTFFVAFVPSLRMPAYLGVMALVAWLTFLSIQGKTARQIPIETILGVMGDVTPFPTARAVTIAGYPNSGTVEGATRFTLRGRLVYMKTLAPLKTGEAAVAVVTPNRDRSGPFADVPFEVLALRNDSRTEAEGRYLRIPDPRMKVPEGTRLWVLVALSVLLIGFLFPIFFIVIIKRSYDIKFGWERAMAEAMRIIGPVGAHPGSADTIASELLA